METLAYVFCCEFFKTLQNSFFIEHLWTATSVLGKNPKNFTINYDLAKFLTALTIIINFTENIWKSDVAMKQLANLRCLGYKIIMNFQELFFVANCIVSEALMTWILQNSKFKPSTKYFRRSTSIIHFDGLCNYLYSFRRRQLPVSL